MGRPKTGRRFVGGSLFFMFLPLFIVYSFSRNCSTLCPFYICYHLAEEERASNFTLIVTK